MAVGVIVGRADVLEAFNQKTPAKQNIRHSGTWNGNPLLCSAGRAACKLYLNGEPQRKANELGAYLRDQGNKVLREKNISGRLHGRNMPHLYLGPIDYEPTDPTLPPTRSVQQIMNPAMTPIRNELCLRLLHRGIATMGAKRFILSGVHTKEDVDQTIGAFSAALDDMVADGTLKTA